MENPQRLDEPRLPYKREKIGILIGMLLGDASITKRYNNKITISHGEKQKEYLLWKLRMLESLGMRGYKVRSQVHNSFGPETVGYIVDVADDVKIPWLYRKMYGSGKKKLTINLLRHLNPYGLAMWYMDDGSRNHRGGGRRGYDAEYFCLNTQGFSLEEHELMRSWFKKKYNITTSIQKDKHYHKLYFGGNGQANIFMDMVRPYIHPTMDYKVCRAPYKGRYPNKGDDRVHPA